MPQPRSQNRSLAYDLWCKSNGKRALADIANELQISPELVRKWKSQDKWEAKHQPTVRNRGGQQGNKNAASNSGGAPTRNVNAVRTGEFESILIDTLTSDEANLIERIRPDKSFILQEEIMLLTIRERRMMLRIATATSMQDFETIHRIEEALTRVQVRKQVAVDQLHKIDVDDRRHDLDLKRLEIDLIKAENANSHSEEPVDDNFITAMESRTAEVWTDDSEDD